MVYSQDEFIMIKEEDIWITDLNEKKTQLASIILSSVILCLILYLKWFIFLINKRYKHYKRCKTYISLSSGFSSKLQIYDKVQWSNQEFLRTRKVSSNEGISIKISSTTHKRKALKKKFWSFTPMLRKEF